MFAPETVTISGWNDGTDLWIRWFDANSTGFDQGLAVDDFSFSAVPEPAAGAALMGLVALTLAGLRRRNGKTGGLK